MYWYEYRTKEKGKKWFWKDFSKLMNNSDFYKTIESLKKYRDIKLVTAERRRNNLVSEENFHIIRYFLKNLIPIEMEETQIFMNKSIYLGLSIL